MSQGYLCLVLHAHLPYVRHPEAAYSLEEKWLYEAITETYLPLLQVFHHLDRDSVPYRLTVSLSPTLLSMLADPHLQERYQGYLERTRHLADREAVRTKNLPALRPVVRMYQEHLSEAWDTWQTYHHNLIEGFRHFQEKGNLEVITCAATHGYLPLIGLQREAVRAQVRQAVETYRRYLGQNPRGIWLPECAYNPGDDAILAEFGLQYFIMDTHGLLFARPRPRYAIYAPLACPESGVAAFGRDMESSLQVWSANEGYPGDPDYREFYRDIGYDLEHHYIKDFIHPDGLRIDTGLKYYRITGKTENKQPYNPEWARQKAALHAGNFMYNRERQVEYLASVMDRPPVVVCPYDAELFGHWWYEGPQWLEFLCRKSAYDQSIYQLATPGEYLEHFPHNQPATPCASSWGNEGYHNVWLDETNDWIYRHLHHAASDLIHLSQGGWSASQRRSLAQAVRELLLAQASDWAFIMKTGTMVDYAQRRTVSHLGRLRNICQQLLTKGQVDEAWLTRIEELDNAFAEVDPMLLKSI